MRAIIASALVGLIWATPGLAEINESGNGWFCGAKDEWTTATLTPAPDITINNFYFGIDRSRRSKAMVLQISYSATNRTGTTQELSGQFIGFAEDRAPRFAASVTPDFRWLKPGSVTARESVFVAKRRVLRETTMICAYFTVAERK